MSFNKVIVVGNLGRDPELRYTPQGTAVCNFTMATNERRKDKSGEQQDITTWFKITVWGKQAETVSKYLTKGRNVYVEGRLHVEEWTDKEGKTRHTLEVNASDVHFIDSGAGERDGSGASRQYDQGDDMGAAPQSRPASAAAPSRQMPARNAAVEDDEIPF
ncbi:MAG: single-stranded DNA-binding protein [Pyrinomonadaceae bacterium]